MKVLQLSKDRNFLVVTRDGLNSVEGASSNILGPSLKDCKQKESMFYMAMVSFEISTISPQCSDTEGEDDLGHVCITKGADFDLGGYISSEEDELELPVVPQWSKDDDFTPLTLSSHNNPHIGFYIR